MFDDEHVCSEDVIASMAGYVVEMKIQVLIPFPHGAIRAFHQLTEHVRRCMVAQPV